MLVSAVSSRDFEARDGMPLPIARLHGQSFKVPLGRTWHLLANHEHGSKPRLILSSAEPRGARVRLSICEQQYSGSAPLN